ncbi:hypothetical protein BDV29DRAFT_157295 [Aspergillus leporis]|uniref:Uncharacterized protein n=1 Tax=Aspergillus leporis TaxID=41062 RepID=A0A5N5WZ62_9EURO|nr:hypothetical protein BDV29DRAFT_157295 [Aspergillus leporis]
MSTIGSTTATPTSSDHHLDAANRRRESFKTYGECMQEKVETLEEEVVRLRSEVEILEIQLSNIQVALPCQAEETGGLIALNVELSGRVKVVDILLTQRHSNIAELKIERDKQDIQIESPEADLKQRDILVNEKDARINALRGEIDKYEDRVSKELDRNATLMRSFLNAKRRIKELEKTQQTRRVREGSNKSRGKAHEHFGNVKIKSFWHLFYLLWH